MKPVFSRLDDSKRLSRKRILLFAILFFVATRIITAIAIGCTTALYKEAWGVDAMAALNFGANLDALKEEALQNGFAATILMVAIGAPLLEECAFRLALSFRKRDVSIGLGAMTLFLASRFLHSWWWSLLPAVAVAAVVWFATKEEFWNSLQPRWLKTAAILSAVLFGLAHMFAMHGLTPELLPLALLICLMLFFAGATFVYLRVNLGFGWGLAAHILNNLPATLYLVLNYWLLGR